MFGHHRPKPDARMFRHLLARLQVPAHRCVLVEDTLEHQKAAHALGMRTVWMQRYLDGRFRGTLRDGINNGRRPREVGVHPCRRPPYVYARINSHTDAARPAMSRIPRAARVRTRRRWPRSALAPRRVRKRPKPGERRVQILQTLAAMLEQPGAERITTAALAAKLDVSEAALYRHFASKAQMFEGLIEFIESSVFTLVNQINEREAECVDAGAQGADRAAAVRREEPGHDPRDGRRCAGVRERSPARAHEPVLRPHRVAAAPEPARRPPKPRARPRRRWMRMRAPRCSPPSRSGVCSAMPARASSAVPPSTSTLR